MPRHQPFTILCLSSFFKGNDFIREFRRSGGRVILLTRERKLDEEWARESLDDIIAVPGKGDEATFIQAATHVAQHRRIGSVIALEEYDVVTAARVREYLCLPGHSSTVARNFQDKLAMRARARESGVRQPQFVHLLNHNDITDFVQNVSPPWMLKPRVGASSMGVKKLYSSHDVWREVEELNRRESFVDRAPSHLLEGFIPGDVYHVDSLSSTSEVRFANVSRYGFPPFDVVSGGVSTSRTVERGSPDERALLALNETVLRCFGFTKGTTHAEFIKGEDDEFYFLEIAARVGGAHTAEMVEAATGVNLWREWAHIEIASDSRPYIAPTPRKAYGGIAVTLARQEWPDTSPYQDPEIVYRIRKPWHAGLVVRSNEYGRLIHLLDDYTRRFSRDFVATAPPEERPDLYL